MRSSSWSSALLLPLLVTLVSSAPIRPQALFELEPTLDVSATPMGNHISGLARLTALYQCSPHPTILQPTSSTSSGRQFTVTYIQPSPLQTTSAAVALLSSLTSQTDLVPLQSSLLPNVPEDVLVMRFIRDSFESETSDVFSLLERSLTRVGRAEEIASIEVVGSGIAGPLALLHGLRLHHSLPPSLRRTKVTITLFSSPRFANEAFSNYLQSYYSPNLILNIVSSSSDALPLLPSRGAMKSGYRDLHAGTRWEMIGGGEIRRWESGLKASVKREDARKMREERGDASEVKGWEAQFGNGCSAPLDFVTNDV